MNSPFKFLDAYELKDRAAFFGREAEIEALYQLVTQNRLTFVYGPSGIGKTSLVQCGLASRFDSVDWLPLFIRRGDDINAALRREIGKALGQDTPYAAHDLSAAVDTLYKDYLRPVYLIFDQFEELFILGQNDDVEQERLPFYETIAGLLDAKQPCRILFIMREDYFGHLNEFEQVVPELYHRKLRVEPMNRDNLRAVIAGSCRVHGIGFDHPRESPELVLANIQAEKKAVHMPYVQVYLHILYQEAAKTGEPPTHFSDAVIGKVGPIADVLGRFLEEQKESISNTLRQNPAFSHLPEGEDVVSQVLDVFVSTEGTKAPVGYTVSAEGQLNLGGHAARVLANLPPALVSTAVLELENNRILRRTDDTFELAHDTLAELLDKNRGEELSRLRNIRRRIEAGWNEHEDSKKTNKIFYFDREQLIRIEPFLPKIALEPEQAAFLDASYAEAERLENEEKERIARQKADAQRRQRRAMWTSVIAAVLILTALGTAWVAYDQYNKAAEAVNLAERETRKSDVAQKAARIAEADADAAKKDAVQKRQEADDAKKEAAQKKREADDAQKAARIANADAQAAIKQSGIDSENARLALLKAETEQKKADEATRRAEEAKIEAQKAAKQGVKALLTVAEQAVKQLNYAEASEAVNAAVRLEADTPAVAAAVLEMAFYHNHTGDRKTAAQETATAARWLNRSDLAAQAERLTADARPLALRAVQKALAPARFRELDERYFPKMIPVKGGTFIPGCVKPDDGMCQEYNKDGLYRATVRDFELAETETTVLQYHLYATALGRRIGQRITPADTLREYDTPTWGWPYDHPVIYISWYDAVEYANWASEQQGLQPVYDIVKTARDPGNQNSNDEYGWLIRIREDSDGYRLPTEAEWEFAARGGTKQDTFLYAGSDDLDEVAWYYGNSGGRTHAVRGKKPNTLQLYDLSGNVWEWCWDWHGAYPQQAETDYRGATSGEYRVLRGGSWRGSNDDYFRPASRYRNDPDDRINYDGFRVARH